MTAPAVTVAEALSRARAALGGDRPARLEAEVLLAHALGWPRARLHAWPGHRLGPAQHRAVSALLRRRRRGEPVAYLTGRREFWSLDLRVTPDTLIPRPETERLVELALERLPANGTPRVADIGTGSGAIALALASERPTAHISAVDVCPRALAVAQDNARRLGLGRVEFHCGELLAPLLDNSFDMVCANLPYVADGDPHLEQDGLPFEPRAALVAAKGGLALIEALAAQAREVLPPGGWLVLEHGSKQGPAVTALLGQLGYGGIQCAHDHAHLPRVSLGQWQA
ncbi:MAG TPA: peptide chain release factor N(5)-glutamine methyltransferase [Anaerolineae bacterium]|nr:peptide chain release factor N(5)-glutamine methyltransferase [Anaerolineae bacterium]